MLDPRSEIHAGERPVTQAAAQRQPRDDAGGARSRLADLPVGQAVTGTGADGLDISTEGFDAFQAELGAASPLDARESSDSLEARGGTQLDDSPEVASAGSERRSDETERHPLPGAAPEREPLEQSPARVIESRRPLEALRRQDVQLRGRTELGAEPGATLGEPRRFAYEMGSDGRRYAVEDVRAERKGSNGEVVPERRVERGDAQRAARTYATGTRPSPRSQIDGFA